MEWKTKVYCTPFGNGVEMLASEVASFILRFLIAPAAVNYIVFMTPPTLLRPQSRFFTKLNFNNAVDSIPDGSTVIFGFGEIDCREGILLAVARDRYADLEEVQQC